MTLRNFITILALFIGASTDISVPAAWAQAPASRPMTFLDMQQMRQVSAETPSPDGKWMLYTLSTPDWRR